MRKAAYPENFMNFLKKENNYEEVATEEMNFRKLLKGRVDYIVSDHGNSIIMAKEMGVSQKVMPLLSKAVREDNVYIVFSKKTTEPEFVKKFSDALSEFKKQTGIRKYIRNTSI